MLYWSKNCMYNKGLKMMKSNFGFIWILSMWKLVEVFCARLCVCLCVCVWCVWLFVKECECEGMCVCVCVCMRKTVFLCACVNVKECEGEKVCVCVWERERERERERVRVCVWLKEIRNEPRDITKQRKFVTGPSHRVKVKTISTWNWRERFNNWSFLWASIC